MEYPVNAVYKKGEEPKGLPQPLMIGGLVIPGHQRWMVGAGLVGAAVVFVFVTLILLPSGIPFLAAKQADGFLGYTGLFFLYMMSFVLLVFGILAGMALLGLGVRRQIENL